MSALLSVRNLDVEIRTPDGPLRAVEGISFEMPEGEVLGLVGESGSGKTLTCRSILRLLPRKVRIAGGEVVLAGQSITALPESRLGEVRGPLGAMIFQNPASHLDPVMTVGDQIAAPIRVHEGASRAEARARARDLLAQVGIPDPGLRLDQYPHEFSGGMRQRVMIASALACRPKLLIADEPTTALDVTVQAQILRLLLDLRDRFGLSILLVTHDLGVVAQTCGRIAVMYAGRLIEIGTKAAVLRKPLHPYTAGLISSQPGAGLPGSRLASIPGQPPGLADKPGGCAFAPRCAFAQPACRAAPPPEAEPIPGHHTACIRWRTLAEVA